MTFLPTDLNDNAIPALRLKDGGAQNISITATAAENSLAFDTNTKIISLYADVDCFIKFGVSDTVTATSSDHFFPAGLYYDLSIGGGESAHLPYISAIRAGSTDGTLYISEKN